MSDLTCSGCGEYAGTHISDRIEALETQLAEQIDYKAAFIEARFQLNAADALAAWAKAISERKASPATGGRLVLERDLVGLETALAAYNEAKKGGA